MSRAKLFETTMFLAVFSLCAFSIFPHLSSSFDVFAAEQVASTAEMGATITPNPTNTLALQLHDWQDSLDARQSDLQKREQEVRDENALTVEKQQRVLLGVILFFLAALVVTNTYTHHRDLMHEHYVLAHAGIDNTLDFHTPRTRAGPTNLRVKIRK